MDPRAADATLRSSAEAARPILEGIQRYDIESEVGRGAMGIVYRATHKLLKKTVALKVVRPGESDPRFHREAQVLASIRSPFVVAVHDFEELPDGTFVLCMEWVDGGNLSDVMRSRGGRLRENQTLRWMDHVAQGMSAVAEEGIAHRDLKPSNVLIGSDGRARVADFGLARWTESRSELSQSTTVMGTPYYMAPEQAEDPHGADTRADIYSYGATFYHALTGRPPFDGPNAIAVLFKHKTEPVVPPRSLVPSLTPTTNDLLERCLAKSPVARFQAFSEIHSMLGSDSPEPDVWGPSDDDAFARDWERYLSRRAFYLKPGGREGTLDVYEFPGSRRLHIVRGNIVHQEVDAIVSSNQELIGESHGTASAIREAGGDALQRELRSYENVRPGRSIVTAGGNLYAKFVFHAVTIGHIGREYAYPNRDLIAEVMGSCFYHADTLRLRSVAFPLLGTGGAGWAHDICLDTMFRFLARTLVKGLTGVRSVRIVIYPRH